jgi:hypothetical protein
MKMMMRGRFEKHRPLSFPFFSFAFFSLLVLGKVHHALDVLDADVVAQDVEASQVALGLLDHRSDLGRFCDVGAGEERTDAKLLLEGGGGLGGIFGVHEAVHDDVC